MSTSDDVDRLLGDYLERGPAELADRVLWAARAQLTTTRQAHVWPASLALWRNPRMTRKAQLLLAGGALAAAIGAGGIGLSMTRPDPSPATSMAPPAPGASASPVAAAPVSAVPDASPTPAPARAAGWIPTGAMAVARADASATLLLDGKVLIAGGRIGPTMEASTASAELYDPRSGTWSATGSMHGPRDGQTATRLLDGRVLVAGGASRAGMGALATAELYDPSSGTWQATGVMLAQGRGHTATLLPNGTVLVVGGDGNPTLAEVYDPASGTWTATARPKIRYHLGHAATLLPDGRVLVTGGPPNGRDGTPTAELYDPRRGSWTLTANMLRVRMDHAATSLSDGRVLVAGGHAQGGSSESTASAEVYDPSRRSWTAVGKMVAIRGGGWTATQLTDGTVLAAGGFRIGGNGMLASAELYDPGPGTWTAAGTMATSRARQTATVLPDGRVLVAGGMSVIDGTARPQASAELYDPGTGH
jgi:hypothetical protein